MPRSNEEQLVVLLEARIGDLEKKMAKAQGVTAKAYRQMSRGSRTATASMERDMTRASRRIEQASASAAAGIGRLARAYVGPLAATFAAGLFGKTFIEKTIAQQKAVAQVEAVIKSTGAAAGVTSEAAQELAASLQKVSTYGDEAILPAESILLTFTKIGKDVFPEATGVVLDMATALHTDLKSAALQVGKALQDPVTQLTYLRRSGVSFTTEQQKVIKSLFETGHEAKAQMMILKELQREFQGSARAARDTLGGALEALGNAFGDAFELHGPAVDNLQHEIEDLITTVTDPAFKQGLADIGSGIFSFLGDVSQAVVTLDQDVSSAIDAIHRLENAAPSINNLGDKIAHATGLDNIGAMLLGSRPNALGMYSRKAVEDRIDAAFSGGASTQNEALTPQMLEDRFSGAERGGRLPKTTATQASSTTLTRKSTGSKTTVDALRGEVKQIQQRTRALQAMTAVQAGINPLVDDYGQAIATAQAKQELLNAVEKTGKTITPELAAQIDKVAESYGNATASANRLADAQHRQQQEMREWKDAAKGALDSFVNGIENGETAFQALGDAALSVLDKIINKIENELVDALFDANNAGGGGGGLFGSLFSGIGSLFGGIGGSTQRAAGLATGIGLFAKGGIADKPSIFAESGPEAAVPLPDGRRIPVELRGAGSGSDSNVHVDVGVTVDQEGKLQAYVKNVSQQTAAQGLASYRNSDQMTKDVAGHYAKGRSQRYIKQGA